MPIVSNGKLQERFVLYMKDKELRAGDYYKGYEYIIWIQGHIAVFKRSIGRGFYDLLTQSQQNEFTEYLRSVVADNKSSRKAS